jgi:hypothetical protein
MTELNCSLRLNSVIFSCIFNIHAILYRHTHKHTHTHTYFLRLNSVFFSCQTQRNSMDEVWVMNTYTYTQYTCIHIYIHTPMQGKFRHFQLSDAKKHTHIHTCIQTCINTYINAGEIPSFSVIRCEETYTHTCIQTYIHTYINAGEIQYTCIQTNIHTPMQRKFRHFQLSDAKKHTHIHTCIQTCINKYINTGEIPSFSVIRCEEI